MLRKIQPILQNILSLNDAQICSRIIGPWRVKVHTIRQIEIYYENYRVTRPPAILRRIRSKIELWQLHFCATTTVSTKGLHQNSFGSRPDPTIFFKKLLLHYAISVNDITTRECHTVGAATGCRVWVTDTEGLNNLGVRVSKHRIAESSHTIVKAL